LLKGHLGIMTLMSIRNTSLVGQLIEDLTGTPINKASQYNRTVVHITHIYTELTDSMKYSNMKTNNRIASYIDYNYS